MAGSITLGHHKRGVYHVLTEAEVIKMKPVTFHEDDFPGILHLHQNRVNSESSTSESSIVIVLSTNGTCASRKKLSR